MTSSLVSRTLRQSALALGTFLVASACEGGSPGGNDNDPPGPEDELAPLTAIQFPPSGSLTDAASVNLVIAAEDESGVALVRANGIDAFVDADGLWKVSVPLHEGENSIVLEARDTKGNSSSAPRLSIRRESGLWIEPSAIAFDGQAGETLVLDPPTRSLFHVDPGTGARTLVSGPGVGGGASLSNARDVDHVASRNAAVVTDGALDAVLLVDLSTGARSTLSSPGIGGGPTPFELHGVAVDEARDRALVVDDFLSAVLAVDLTSGLRSVVSADGAGTGPLLIGPRRIAIDPVRNRALVTVALSRAIVAVDLGTGNRSVLSGGAIGTGPAFAAPFDLAVDSFRDRALVTDPAARAVFEVDLATGARRVLSAAGVGTGPLWLSPTAVALHLVGVPLVVDRSLDALVQVGALSGDRLIVSAINRGAGPQLARPARFEGQSLPAGFVVADPSALLSVSLANGGRGLLSGVGRGFGPAFADLVAVGVFASPGCIIALDAGRPGLFGVDPQSGDRGVMSDVTVGSGPPFAGPRDMALVRDTATVFCAGVAFVVDKPLGAPGALLRVELPAGARSILSDETHGTGSAMVDPVAIELHPNGPALVLDAESSSILTIDLDTGDRSTFFAFPAPLGAPTDFVLDEPQNRVLVLDASPPALLAGALDSLAVDALSDAQNGIGPLFGRPSSLALVPSPTVGEVPSSPIAFVLDSARGSILAVDPATGDRVIWTK